MNIKITQEEISSAIQATDSMVAAAALLNIQFSTFKRYATKFNLYCINQGAKGRSKPKREGFGKIALQEILFGNHPQYGTYKLKHRLFEVGLKSNICECCGIVDWCGKPISCELDHIDGNRTNHLIDNLRILCPNCHSQTETFRSKKRILR